MAEIIGKNAESGAAIREAGAPDGDLIGHSTNLVGLSTPFLADIAFNAQPVPVHISGVREMNGGLFEMLGLATDLAEAGDAFAAYMMAMFGIDIEQREPGNATGRRRYRSSYLRLIKGWGYDSNSPEGAVLKGWVESRFGIFPTFHRERLVRQAPAAWAAYVAEKMSSRFHNNSIMAQLDLLYEFCQWALVSFVSVAETHLTLYRGVNDFNEHAIRQQIDRRRIVMRLNSLSSFTAEREIADCFGDVILTARVPREKILFFNTLMTSHPLKGEGEYLVIGGDYELGVSR